MYDPNKKYWLYIAPFVYCNIKDNQALLYNTQTGVSIETINSDIIVLLESLHKKENLGVVDFEGRLLIQETYREFIVDFCQKGMGNLVDISKMPQKPIQLMPVLNLQCDVEKLQQAEKRYSGEEILQYLLELNIYLNNNCKQNCRDCNSFFKQSLCCKKDDNAQSEILDVLILRKLLSQIRFGVVGKLNLLGGNVLDYPYFDELASILTEFIGEVHIWNHYANMLNCRAIIPEYIYNLIITFPLVEHNLELSFLSLKEAQVKCHFYVTCIEEYKITEELIEKYRISNFSIHPMYINTNLDFFKEFIYTNRDDIFESNLPFHKIFAHQKLNTNFFGSLTVLTDGTVHANMNSFPLGNISSETLLDIINKEMLTNSAWRKVRDIAPCSECLYQYLCPSPSNYELVIGKANLCNVN